MKTLLICFLTFTTILSASAQQKSTTINQPYVDFTIGIGSSEMSFASGIFYNWTIGKKKKIFIGTGARLTAYTGKDKYFTSAPSNLASEINKTDTLFSTKTNIYALNALINLGYNFSPKFQIGFNIDLLGLSFGPESSYKFQGNGSQTNTIAKPTTFNLLLVGTNDKGSLNSELYVRYKFNQKFGMKIGYEHLFTELTTSTKIQTVPEQNDRFRRISDLLNIGASYHF